MEKDILESGVYNPKEKPTSSLQDSLAAFRKREKLSEKFREDSHYTHRPPNYQPPEGTLVPLLMKNFFEFLSKNISLIYSNF